MKLKTVLRMFVAAILVTATSTLIAQDRMGDRVVKHTPTNLDWTSSNTDSVSILPIGTVSTKGDQEVKPVPKQTANGPVDENVTYTLTATNVCGGSERRTVNVHITGIIKPAPDVPLVSVVSPTSLET